VCELFRIGCRAAKKKAIPLESPFLTPAENAVAVVRIAR
jgi:hypothetical protein